MKINLTSILGFIVLALGLVVFLQYQHIDKISNKRTPVLPVPIPPKHGAIPFPVEAIPEKEYIYVPTVVGIDSTILKKYQTENDSLRRELILKDAITIREYNQTFEDGNLSVSVKSRVRGTQLGLSIPSYTIKGYTYNHSLPPTPRDIDLFIGLELGVPTVPFTSFVAKANLELQIEKLGYSLGYDTEQRVWGGLSYKLL